MRQLFSLLVPRDWTGEQALVAARLLRYAIDAIWHVHGEEMAEAIADVPVDRWCEHFAEDIEQVDEGDEIPF